MAQHAPLMNKVAFDHDTSTTTACRTGVRACVLGQTDGADAYYTDPYLSGASYTSSEGGLARGGPIERSSGGSGGGLSSSCNASPMDTSSSPAHGRRAMQVTSEADTPSKRRRVVSENAEDKLHDEADLTGVAAQLLRSDAHEQALQAALANDVSPTDRRAAFEGDSDKKNARACAAGNEPPASCTRGGGPEALGAHTVSDDSNCAPPAAVPAAGSIPSGRWSCDGRYDLIQQIGEGSYGKVVSAHDKLKNAELVAIKRIESDIFDHREDLKRIYREMFILRHLEHPAIVQLKNVIAPCGGRGGGCGGSSAGGGEALSDLLLVFEHCDTDLHQVICNSKQQLTIPHVQYIMYQLFAALAHIHANGVIHRDLKPANILINASCAIKIADFGLARAVAPASDGVLPATPNSPPRGAGRESLMPPMPWGPGGVGGQQAAPNTTGEAQRQLTAHVVTRYYRAPELLLLMPYSYPIDVWAAGCVMAELLATGEGSSHARKPVFPGKACYALTHRARRSGWDKKERDELVCPMRMDDQLNVIFDVIGTPDPADVEHVPSALLREQLRRLSPKCPVNFKRFFPAAPESALSLMRSSMKFNADARVSARGSLESQFLSKVRNAAFEKPAPARPINMSHVESAKPSRQLLQQLIVGEACIHDSLMTGGLGGQ